VPLPIGVQLYTFRDPARFGGVGLGLDVPTLEAIADAGFLGVETVGVPGDDPLEARRVLAALGLAVTSAHAWADVEDAESVRVAAAGIAELGATRMIVSPSPPTGSVADVDRLIDRIGEAAMVAASQGLRLGCHNHDREMRPVEGTRVIDRLATGLGDAVDFQVDIFWVTVGGAEPADVIARLGRRVVSLHLKDGVKLPSSADDDTPFVNVPVGDGVVDPAPAIAAAEASGSAQWLIVEFDHVDGSAIEACRRSLETLTARGLAQAKIA
jgi:sugar phosphate isomerase/epimerase